MTTEVYLRPYQLFIMKPFCLLRLLTFNDLLKKAPAMMFDRLLNTSLMYALCYESLKSRVSTISLVSTALFGSWPRLKDAF